MSIGTKPLFSCVLELERHAVKKNNRPIHGRGLKKWIGKSADLRRAEMHLTALLMKEKEKWPSVAFPLSGDLHVLVQLSFPNYYTKEGLRNRKLADLSNLLELPADCLQAAGIIANDGDICSWDGSKRRPGNSYRLEILIWQLKHPDGMFVLL